MQFIYARLFNILLIICYVSYGLGQKFSGLLLYG